MNKGLTSILKRQFDRVDNSSIIIFRMLFGLLIFAESVGAIITGWVNMTFIEPRFTFTVIGLEWLQPLPGIGMHIYFGVMAVLGLMIMFGYFYRASISMFTLLWTITYLMQKSNYNNHYYLLILLCLFMCIIPAQAYASVDAKRYSALTSLTCPRWCISIFKVQLWIVFTYAAIAKLYPGWLEGDFIQLIFLGKGNYPLLGSVLQTHWLQDIIIYGGIFFDLTIIYFLLWPKTRKFAFFVAIVFHLFNSAVFQIGIFPYLMIALCIFFFDPDIIRKQFLKQKPAAPSVVNQSLIMSPRRKVILFAFGLYFLFQIMLPLRHHGFQGDVFWTEEGHRLSWRMMLRTKSGTVDFIVRDVASDSSWTVNPRTQLSRSQAMALPGKPDMIWQFAQRLEEQYKTQGMGDLQIYARSRVRLNKSSHHSIIDVNQDLTDVKWESLKHSNWILTPSKQ